MRTALASSQRSQIRTDVLSQLDNPERVRPAFQPPYSQSHMVESTNRISIGAQRVPSPAADLPQSAIAPAPDRDTMATARPDASAPAIRVVELPRSAPAAAKAKDEAGYRAALEAYNKAIAEFDATQARPYWQRVVALQQQRHNRPIASLTDADFVNDPPPVLRGVVEPNPSDYGLPVEPRAPSTIPVVRDFIAAADRLHFQFDLLRPGATDEQRRSFETAFRKRYAELGLATGMTAEQMLGVYAFETGGVGAHDTQAGLEFGGKRQISTALGYGQLLAANSNTVFAEHGDLIAARLDAEGKHAKAELVRRMSRAVFDAVRNLTSPPAEHDRPPTWKEAQRIAKTDLGRAVHAANLDLDIGPHMQTVKLHGIIDSYNAQAAANRMPITTMSPEMMEMMNLAGAELGFQMEHPRLGDRLTVNFFEQDGYEANPVARRGRTGAGLLQIMRDTMAGANSRASGSLEFRRIFTELAQQPR